MAGDAVSAVSAIAAISLRKTWLMVLAGVLALPFCLYALPYGLVVFLACWGAVAALNAKRVWLAATLVVPFFLLAAFFLRIVLSQPDPRQSPRAIQWQQEHGGLTRP